MNSAAGKKAMRDVFIGKVLKAMSSRPDLYFLTADFGAPLLDEMRKNFPCQFVNVGIAEQNLINVSAGMAFEGLTVHAYAISSFLATRAFEQVKINLSLHSQVRDFNVNLVGVGAGLSYDISGPTHHCLEDISIVNSLPGITLFSPSDWILVEKFHDYALSHNSPKYLRLEGKPVPALYDKRPEVRIEDCFCELKKGEDVCIVSTGFMTHLALEAVRLAGEKGLRPGLIDLFLLKPLDGRGLAKVLSAYRKVITVEEGFVGKGGMDSIVSNLLNEHCPGVRTKALGFGDKYVFERGDRAYLHKLYGIDASSIAALVARMSGRGR
ncbi:MAG: transketolase [Elusimicrobia bacterium GWC2_56_31]|nr:MAG: transketolase [Elusimicrobia bacterium GWC2_56_31]HBB67673.1 transketolase [Elusimicrobiota bacterium]HBW22855.1 transketolase [Elusimicrobiota bacterium]